MERVKTPDELFGVLLDMTAWVDDVDVRVAIEDESSTDSGSLSKAFLGILSGRFENGLPAMEDVSSAKVFVGSTSGRVFSWSSFAKDGIS